jgi:hypothetical protein
VVIHAQFTKQRMHVMANAAEIFLMGDATHFQSVQIIASKVIFNSCRRGRNVACFPGGTSTGGVSRHVGVAEQRATNFRNKSCSYAMTRVAGMNARTVVTPIVRLANVRAQSQIRKYAHVSGTASAAKKDTSW